MLSWAFLPSRVLPFSSGFGSVLSVAGLRSSHGLETNRLTVPVDPVLQSVARGEVGVDSPESADPPGVFGLFIVLVKER
jgi:hypothetical protein